MELYFEDLQNYAASFIWILTRIAGVFVIAPVIGSRLVPIKIKIVFVLAFSFIIALNYNANLSIDPFSIKSIFILVNQFIIGLVIGFVFQIVFQIFLLVGEFIAMQSGLGFAVLNDPSSKSSVPMVSQLYLMLVTLLFFLLDGHLALIKAAFESFKFLPISDNWLDVSVFKDLAYLGTWMFKTAFAVALPAVTALLLVNAGFGVITRAAPQLNIFSIGFPVTMILGMIVLWLNLSIITPHFTSQYEFGMNFVSNIFEQNNKVLKNNNLDENLPKIKQNAQLKNG